MLKIDNHFLGERSNYGVYLCVRRNQMKNLQIVVFILLVSACSVNSDENYKPERPAGVSEDAFWVGGIGGGYWYIVHSVHDHRNGAIISVYDEEGTLTVKKKFNVICRIDKPVVWIKNLEQQISGFDGKKILLNSRNGREICWMQ